MEPAPGGGYDVDPHHDGDGFIEVDHDIQKAILLEGEHAAASGDQPRLVIRQPWDAPVSADPLIGELGPALGHGTFIAGIVRQVAPQARVLAIRIMHSDDILYEGDLLTALTALAGRVALAQATDPAKTVDVVSLSFGYLSESPADQVFTSALWQAIQVLLDLGVVGRGRGGKPLDHPHVLPGGVRPAAGPGRPGTADQRGRSQPERIPGRLQRRWPLGDRVGIGRRRGQHHADRRQRQPQP